ncbi:BON domain-containing protein [Ramlibacter sp. XY19]|uniref:BON domain-containing protein n=1 Tax=Ramlibacter paludis TaxID=2908000 RepID=UPI0023DC2A40|nr:BON domain-containing protein [Ramlibacter paludis]MCG2592082.1 BON domain-containing protein [Ramlibacter paludis]
MNYKGIGRAAALASSLAVLLALGACGDRVEESAPASQASVEINRQGMEGAKEESAAVGVENPNTAAMGAAPAPVADDPDIKLAAEVKSSLAADPDFTAMKIDVHSDDGVVTLIGRAPDPAARERASQIARNVREVKSVENQLTLG